MTTPLTLINAALRDSGVIGVGQTASAEDSNDAFDKINRMLAIWNLRRWLVYHLKTIAVTSTGAASYTIGPTGDFVCARVDRIEGGFVRQVTAAAPNQPDTMLTVIEARETFNAIPIKGLVGLPSCVFLDSGFPTGTLYFHPVPTATIYQMHISVKDVLVAFTSMSQTIVIPAEYEEAIVYNLAVRLRAAYQMAPDPIVSGLARAALNTIKNANAQIASLRMPANLPGTQRRGGYNIYTDSYR